MVTKRRLGMCLFAACASILGVVLAVMFLALVDVPKARAQKGELIFNPDATIPHYGLFPEEELVTTDIEDLENRLKALEERVACIGYQKYWIESGSEKKLIIFEDETMYEMIDDKIDYWGFKRLIEKKFVGIPTREYNGYGKVKVFHDFSSFGGTVALVEYFEACKPGGGGVQTTSP